MGVHELIDAYVVMRNLCGDDIYFMDNAIFGNRYHHLDPYKGILRISFIALYDHKIVFLVSVFAINKLKELFDSLTCEYEVIDYGASVQFRVNMTPKQVIEFHSNLNDILKKIEDSL